MTSFPLSLNIDLSAIPPGPQGAPGPAGKDGVGYANVALDATGTALVFTRTDGTLQHVPLPAAALGGVAATPAPAPAQSGPLTMGAVTDGSPVTLGSGPDTLTLTLANNPGQPGHCSVAVMLDMADGSTVVVAAPLTISSSAGQGGGQLFTLHGAWGALGKDVKNVRIAPANPPGMAGLWQNAVSYNYQPLAPVAGQGYDSRGGMTDGYTPNLFNSNGIAITYEAQPAAKPAAPTSTGVVTANNLAPLLSNVAAGATITLPGGITTGSSAINAPAIIQGAADGSTVLDATGAALTQNKAVLVPTVSGATVQNLAIKGASLSGALGSNGAGIRQSGDGIGFTVKNVAISHCQDGILTFGVNDTIELDGVTLTANGAGDGFTHNFYGGAGGGTVIANNVISTAPAGGHAWKCRTANMQINGGIFEGGTHMQDGSPLTDGGASVIDLPEGGAHMITGATIRIPLGAPHTEMLGYGQENGNAATDAAHKTLTLNQVVFDNQTGGPVHIMGPGSNIPDAVLVLNGCTAKGPIPDITGFATVQGAITAAA